MDRAQFEADLRREGYDVRDAEIKPDEHRAAHAHAFDVRFLVVNGSLTLVFDNNQRTYGPHDTCHVPAGTVHEEHTGADGVRYLVGRRPASPVIAAE
ncbi:MAG TPA: hypothetical protein VGH49_19830 [Xanthobacteraceae bacterium]|jgi:mannose-6-phosphate isomerase-like protein (cupin superfamily)